jgi:hypothetical protein
MIDEAQNVQNMPPCREEGRSIKELSEHGDIQERWVHLRGTKY